MTDFEEKLKISFAEELDGKNADVLSAVLSSPKIEPKKPAFFGRRIISALAPLAAAVVLLVVFMPSNNTPRVTGFSEGYAYYAIDTASFSAGIDEDLAEKLSQEVIFKTNAVDEDAQTYQVIAYAPNNIISRVQASKISKDYVIIKTEQGEFVFFSATLTKEEIEAKASLFRITLSD